MTYREIKKLVEKVSGIKDLPHPSRTRELSDARFVYYALCMRYVAEKKNLIISTELRRMGIQVNRDRTTVIHGIKQFKDLLTDNCWHGKWLYKLCIEVAKNDLRDRIMMKQFESQIPEIKICPPVEYEIVK